MNNEIDWSGWSEEYPYWVVDISDSQNSDWHKLDYGQYIDRDGCYWSENSDQIRVFTKPDNPWVDTLPPIGTECLMLIPSGDYVPCTIIGHYNNKAIAQPHDMNETAYIKEQKLNDGKMTFIPGAEDLLINELTQLLNAHTWNSSRDLAAYIIKNGYHK